MASEVRSLAQRSASAAKEIKTLISASTSRVHDGTLLANQAGETMADVTRAVASVSRIMGEIATASVEQSHGIKQINHAVAQMDDVTQQNAALVEEAAVASQSLENQGQELNATMAFFVVKDVAPRPLPWSSTALPAKRERRRAARHAAVLAVSPLDRRS